MTSASVLVPVRDEAAVIRSTVDAMRAQRFDGELELLFVDGRSEDGTRDVLEQLAREDPRIRVLDNPDRTIPAALNRGLAAASGEYVVRMDAHSWYPPDYVQRGVDRLRRGDVDWVTGPAVPRGRGPWGRRIALALTSALGQGGSAKWSAGAGDPDAEHDLDTGVFAGVWRRETLERIGGWDERFDVNEDAEMAGRVLAAGGRIVCVAGMGAEYAPRESLGALARQYFRFGRFRVRTSRLHPVALRRQHLASAAIAAALPAAVIAPRPLRRSARAGLGAYAIALVALSARAGRGRAAPADVALLPVVLATMHVAWGAGFIAGVARDGVPVEGLRRALRGGS